MVFLADLTYIISGYRSDAAGQWHERDAQELAATKEGKLKAKKRAAESEKKEVKAAKRSFNEKIKLEEEKRSLWSRLTTLKEEFVKVRSLGDDEARKYSDLEAEVQKLQEEKGGLLREITTLK